MNPWLQHVPMSEYGPGHRGVITRLQTRVGAQVLEMRAHYLRTFTDSEWEVAANQEGKPDDAGIDHCGTFVTDWTPTGRCPLWYLLNHSRELNLRMQ